MWCSNARMLSLVAALILSPLLNGLQAQDRVLAWEHSGPVNTFRVIVDGKPPIDVGVPRVNGRLQWPILDAATSFVVEACNAMGVCAQSQTLIVPVPVPVPAPPTNLQIAVIGNTIPITPVVPTGSAPDPPSSPSPSTGATGVSLTPTLTATASNYTNCKVRFDTANPPVTEIDLGASCTFSPSGLVYSTLYRWRFVLTNQYGFTIGDVWTLTTMADPGPPPDPDPGCASMTTSATGYQPISWTACRQDAMDQMEADYVAACPGAITLPVCGATPTTMGGKWFKALKEDADVAVYTSSHHGLPQAWMYQATGNAAYAALAHTSLAGRLTQQEKAGYCAAPNTTIRDGITRNDIREQSISWVRVADTIKPGITGGQYDALVVRIAEQLQGSLHYDCNAVMALGLGDSDQLVGTYFGVVLLYLRNPSCTLCQTLYNYVKIGGLTPTKTPAEYILAPDTARNAIRYYVEYVAVSGEWIESAHYNRGTVSLLIEGADGVKTVTGIDHYPEVTAWIPVHSAYVRSTVMPDLTNITQWGDIEESQAQKMDRARYASILGNLAGLQHGTTEGRKAHGLFVDLTTHYGYTGSGSFNWGIGHHPLWVYDPYETYVDWRDATSGFFEHNRIGYRKAHISASDSAYFHAYWGGPRRYDVALGDNTYPVDHSNTSYNWGHWELFDDGKWQIHAIKDYNASHSGGDANTGPIIHGFASVPGFSKLWSNNTTDYFYMAGTNGGSKSTHRVGTCGPSTVLTYLHENTRSIINLPGTTDLVIVYDRLNAPTTFPQPQCYTAAAVARVNLFNAFHHKFIVNRAYTLPTQSGNAFSWTTETSKAAKMTVAHPASITATLLNEKTQTSYWSAWATTYDITKRFMIRVEPNDNVQFNTFGTVHEIGTPGVITAKEDAGKVQGFHITRADGSKDVLAMFNSEQGADLNTGYLHASHDNDLSVVRYRETGFTISWTAVSASGTLLILNDLNPANSWTLDSGGGAGAIAEDANGQYSVTITGTGAKTITVVGS